MEGGCVHARGYCVDSDNISPLEVARLEHDAAAAHVLLMAIDDAWIGKMGRSFTPYSIEARADEIMCEWGTQVIASSLFPACTHHAFRP